MVVSLGSRYILEAQPEPFHAGFDVAVACVVVNDSAPKRFCIVQSTNRFWVGR